MDSLYMTDDGRITLITHSEDEWYVEDECDEGCDCLEGDNEDRVA